jgi:hypothetical protein
MDALHNKKVDIPQPERRVIYTLKKLVSTLSVNTAAKGLLWKIAEV